MNKKQQQELSCFCGRFCSICGFDFLNCCNCSFQLGCPLKGNSIQQVNFILLHSSSSERIPLVVNPSTKVGSVLIITTKLRSSMLVKIFLESFILLFPCELLLRSTFFKVES